MSQKFCSFLKKYSAEAVKCDVKPLKQMPGPKGFLGIGNLYNYFKIFGKYSFDTMHVDGMKKYNEFGPIVCERMIPGVNIVFLYDPNDIALVFNEDPGDFPRRKSHQAIEKYRIDRPQTYRTAGLLPTNGPEWYKIRSELQKGFSHLKNVRDFLSHVDTVTQEFIEFLPHRRFDKNNEIDDMLDDLSRLNLELTCLLAFDERLNSFSDEQRRTNSKAEKIMKASSQINRLVLPTDQGFQLWRYFDTPAFIKIKKASQYLEDVAIELVAKKRENPGVSLLDQYLKNPNLDVKDLYAMTSDLILAGIHTTAFSTSFALYHIANNPEVQDLIFEEASKILPNRDSCLTPSMMNSEISYTRAVLKETFRLNPISVGVGRILNKDMVLGGYLVPKETIVVTQNQISCRLEKYFHDPLKFKPERWIKTDEQKKVGVHPYLVLPFGHGMRSCIARRLAEQNILVFLVRLMREYKIEWRGCSEPLDVVTKLINEPSSKISIKFHKR